MSANHLIGNRNSTPAESSSSGLRPPVTRGLSGHHLRASADMGSHAAPPSAARNMRPASEVYYNAQTQHQGQSGQDDGVDKDAQQWISEIDSAQTTLEEMAAATLDQDFKDELGAIEQWFKVLSEAERTAALYALLQQATNVQTRFFVGILQQMAKTHPLSSMLSPSGFGEKDPMSNRLSTAMNRLSVEGGSRNSLGLGRPPPSPGATKRLSGLDQAEINSMFPEAAAAIAKQKADFTQRTGTEPRSNRSSAIVGDRTSLTAPTISAPREERGRETLAQPTPWGARNTTDNQNRPKSSQGQQPMGQFSQPPPSAGLRSTKPPPISAEASNQHTNLTATDLNSAGLPLFSPYTGSGNWASMVNTPMVANFSNQESANQANMVASATASKLQAMGTVNSRVMLDDARKYRRSRSTEGQRGSAPLSASLQQPGLPSSLLMNDQGQILSPQQAAALQAQQLAIMQNGMSRSRPPSPGLLSPGAGMAGMNFSGTSHNGYLTALDGNQALVNSMGGLSLGQSGGGFGSHDFDGERHRGRSPRGKRGTSRAPEDPTDVELLKDIPAWLRSLRLHKYTDNLKNIPWQELIQLNDTELDKRGVNALGARRKMLKVFEEVKEAQQKGKILS